MSPLLLIEAHLTYPHIGHSLNAKKVIIVKQHHCCLRNKTGFFLWRMSYLGNVKAEQKFSIVALLICDQPFLLQRSGGIFQIS